MTVQNQKDSKGLFLPGNTLGKGRPKNDLPALWEKYGEILHGEYSEKMGEPTTLAQAVVIRLLEELSDPKKKLSPQLVAIFLDRYFGPVTQTHISASLGTIENTDMFQEFLEWRKSKQLPAPDSTGE